MPSLPFNALTCLMLDCLFTSTSFAADFSARFTWKGIPACSTVSPAFSLSGAPSGTTALAFVMHDRDAPDFRHGGSTVPYTGKGVVPRGAITYVGPCPPTGITHRYTWTIQALDQKGTPLGTAQAAGNFRR